MTSVEDSFGSERALTACGSEKTSGILEINRPDG